MKRIVVAALLAAGTAAWAQESNPSIVIVASAPSGSCTQNLPDQQVVGLGTIYTCQSGTWALVGGGSSTFTALSGDATSTSTGGATVVHGINSVLLSSLSSCILYNTTGTGVPSCATAAQLGTLANIAQYGVVYSAGTTSALTKVTPPATNGFYFIGHNVTGSAAVAPTATASTALPAGTAIGTLDTGTPTLTPSANLWTSNVALAAPSFTGTGTTPAAMSLVAGSGSIPALTANSAGFAAPATGGTAFLYKFPATAAAGILHAAAPATNDGVNESALTSSAVSLSADVTGQLPITAVGSAGLSGANGISVAATGVVSGSALTPATVAATTSVTAPLYATTTKCAAAGSGASPSLVACSAAPAGLFSCATNASGATCVVSTTAVTASSVIQIQPDSSLGTALSVTCNTTADSALTASRVSARTAGTSFTIALGTFTTNPECFSYIIVN